MSDISKQFDRSATLSSNVAKVLGRRAESAFKEYREAVERVARAQVEVARKQWSNPLQFWADGYRYAVDFAQRSVLFLDTMRQRGNQFIEREQAGHPPVLHFDYEMVLDARKFERPVNYALVRITPPEGVVVDDQRRPYIIIDPRAGHGPGIGGFKDDSQTGEALRGGHPVYFVIFYPEPEAGQTLPDVCAAEQQFVRKVRQLHPDSPKPALVGNCQGGWAAMMLASASPDDTGPLMINGAPMSYWGGAWSEGEGDNPMRYSGGLLGGTWLSSLMADLGNGKFDGAWLVQNFESLNPANTLWSKSYNLFANIDKEAPRFLDFERWWGGFYLMNREEIEWITQNLFVGNKVWSGDVKSNAGAAFDLRQIKQPIILFASMGDNITPPQQAFNWVADLYGSTEEIKARGQVIVGLVHQDVGHLGIFVSGKVAKKEYRQMVSVLETIEALPPGLYGMLINESKDKDGNPVYEVEFEERRLEDVVSRLNRFERADEGPFKAVSAVSEFNQRAYELFARPLVQMLSNETSAELQRDFHPLRFDKWSLSDRNPLLWWLPAAAEAVKGKREAVDSEQSWRHGEKLNGELITATLNLYRDLRDAASEAQFFQLYGNLFSLTMADKAEEKAQSNAPPADARDLPVVREALASMREGGYAAALARTAELLERDGVSIPLARIQLKAELLEEYADLLPDLPAFEWKKLRGMQDAIVEHDPEGALATLPQLLADPAERRAFIEVLDRLVRDPRIQAEHPTDEQNAMLARIRAVLAAKPARKAKVVQVRPKSVRK
jgi:pimeloyl-ACP methyl ester carboxylesterase